ncbi:MAG: GNAT family N-acetyltransferase [Rikenellaceae bacterium]
MNLAELKLLRLDENTEFKQFFCEDSDLNEFLMQDALKYSQELLATTFIVENKNDTVAYFSLLNDSVNLKLKDKSARNKLNCAIPNVKRINNYPAIKIGRLAVNERYASNHIGSQILTVIKQWFKPNKFSGCRFVIVDAYSTAVQFYEKNGFKFLTKEDEAEETRLMYFDLRKFL